MSGQIFYHINRIVSWSNYKLCRLDEEFFVGHDFNPYFKYYENKITVPVNSQGEIVQCPAMRFLSAVKKGEVTCNNLPDTAHSIANHFLQYTRELLWESVRKDEFPTLPSRLKCVWLAPALDEALQWVSRLESNNSEFQILKVEAEGILHIADEKFLLGDSEPFSESVEKARRYWRGEFTDTGLKEILFQGKLRIKEIIPNL